MNKVHSWYLAYGRRDRIELTILYTCKLFARTSTKRLIKHMMERGLTCRYLSHREMPGEGVFEVTIEFVEGIEGERVLREMFNPKPPYSNRGVTK